MKVINSLDRLKDKKLLSFILSVHREFVKDRCLIRASSLSYSTLLAIVPLSGLIFALFTAFGAFQQVRTHVQDFIIRMLIPTMHQEILQYFNTFIANSRALGIAGLMVFAFTSILLIDSISENFNAVWGSSNRRNFIAKFTSYSSVIVFGTLFIGASFAISNPIHTLLMQFPEVLFLLRWFIQLLPSMFIFITFLLMITAIPAGKVRLKSSIIGALCGTILWDISRWFFVNGTNYVLRMSVIYGSLAVIPIFLLWLYIIWIIILGSLEITFVHQYQTQGYLKIKKYSDSPSAQILLGLDIFFSVADNFIKGCNPFSVSRLAYNHAISVNQCSNYLKKFSSAKLLFVSPDTRRILPLKDFDSIYAETLMKILIDHNDNFHSRYPVEIADMFLSAGYASIRGITVKELLTRHNVKS